MKIPESIQREYETWRKFLEERIQFHMADSRQHTKEHCARVLLYCLLLAEKMRLTKEETDILCIAAVFHDSCSQDDWYDVGHGQRAADYYREFSSSSELPFDQRCYDIVAYHDRDDEVGKEAFAQKDGQTPSSLKQLCLLYDIFKDADALDRYRLAATALDETMLRTEEARGITGFARRMVTENRRISPNSLSESSPEGNGTSK